MAKTDPELGARVHEHLMSLGLETLQQPMDKEAAQRWMQEGAEGFLRNMGLDVDGDPSIMDTPRRVGDMFANELCAGLNYGNFPKCTTTPNGVKEYITRDPDSWRVIGRVDEMVMVDTINTVSLCEHHFQTISGVTHVAYLPGDKLLGLSKFARVVDFFARRPQVQERMTEQVYAALSFILETEDVAIQQVCTHNCMRARGVMDPNSKTTTSKMGGKFRSVQALRQEFLHGIR